MGRPRKNQDESTENVVPQEQEQVKPENDAYGTYELFEVSYDNGQPKKRSIDPIKTIRLEHRFAEELNSQWQNSKFYYFKK